MIFLLCALWIGGSFTRIYSSGVSDDTVSGMFYKPVYGAMSFVVDSPLKQIITYSDDTMIVYYPDNKKAFKIKSVIDVLQRNSAITDLNEEINSLKKSGYIFLKRETKGDTFITYWTHEKLKTTLKLIYDRKKRVYEVTVKGPHNAILFSQKADDYKTLEDSLYFPKRLITTTKVDTEIFLFDNVKSFGRDSLPLFIQKPLLPENVRVELKGFDKK